MKYLIKKTCVLLEYGETYSGYYVSPNKYRSDKSLAKRFSYIQAVLMFYKLRKGLYDGDSLEIVKDE